MSDKTKKLIGWLIVAVAIIIAAFLGVVYPIPEPPDIQVMGEGDTNLTNLVLESDFIVSAQTGIVTTDAAAFTPTGTYQPISSAGTVTPTISTTGYVAGTLLVLINTSDTTINLADSGTLMLSGAAALSQYDSLTLWFDGTNWIEISGSTN